MYLQNGAKLSKHDYCEEEIQSFAMGREEASNREKFSKSLKKSFYEPSVEMLQYLHVINLLAA